MNCLRCWTNWRRALDRPAGGAAPVPRGREGLRGAWVVLVLFLSCTAALLATAGPVAAQAPVGNKVTGDSGGEASKAVVDEAGPQLDAITRQIVDLMLANHPLIVSQKRLVETAESLPEPRGGIEHINLSLTAQTRSLWFTEPPDSGAEWRPSFGVSVGVPLPLGGNAGKVSEQKLEHALALAKARQDLEELKATLTQQLLANVQRIAQLAHQEEVKRSLFKTLEHRQGQLQQLIQAGSVAAADGVKPLWQDLWELDERLMTLRAETMDLASERLLLIRQTAQNYGGSASDQMLALLLKVR